MVRYRHISSPSPSVRTSVVQLLCWCALLILLVGPGYLRAAEYRLSMLPRYSTAEISKRVNALAEALSKESGLKIRPVLTATFDEYLKKLQNGNIDIGFENPYIYVLASGSHEVIGMEVKGKDGDKFRGIIITAAGSPIVEYADLKGKRIAIVSYTSAGGFLSQKLSMMEQNVDVEKDCQLEVAPENKQENVAFAVFTGDVDAGFIRESALNQVSGMIPANALYAMKGTAWLPNWALSLSRSMAAEDKEKLIQAIGSLKANKELMAVLQASDFRRASDSEYNTIRKAAGLPLP